MSEILIVLMVLGAGVSAYLRARHLGIWSWRRFAVSVVSLSALGIGVGLGVVQLGRRLGPQHALLLTGLAFLLIAVGVILLARWMRPRGGRAPRS